MNRAARLPTVGGNLLLAKAKGRELPAESSQRFCSFLGPSEPLSGTHTRHTRPREVYLHSGGARSMSEETHQPSKETFRVPGWKGLEEESSCLIQPPISLSLSVSLSLSLSPSVWSISWQIGVQTMTVVSGWKWSQLAKWLRHHCGAYMDHLNEHFSPVCTPLWQGQVGKKDFIFQAE